MKNPFKSLKDIKTETKTVIDNSVMGIKTLLDTMFITSQDSKERDQEDLSGYIDSATLLFNKGKAKDSIPQDHRTKEFNKWMKTPIRTARVYETLFIVSPRLLREDWEWYMVCITA